MRASEVDQLIARRLKLARKTSGLTQKQLASTLGVAAQQIQKYESGENRISVARLLEVSKTLGQPLAYFLEGLEYYEDPKSEGEDSDKTEKLQRLLAQVEDDDVKDAIISIIESYLARSA